MERDFTIHFTCTDCGAVYSATRSHSAFERTFRLFCPACAGVLHEGSGYYSLSELAVVLSFDPAATTEAEASSLSKESPPVRRHQKCKNPR
jgi:hypothetical protein